MEENQESNLLPELIDIRNRIMAYNTVHPEGIFVYGFLGFKKDNEQKCECCGDGIEVPDEEKSSFGCFGNKEDIRNLLNMLRDMVEDYEYEDEDEEDSEFINF